MFRFLPAASILSLPLLLTTTSAAIAQISTANDGTGTIVDQQGQTFNISGGSLSGDGSNLFHNFADFNLSASQIASFLSTPDLQNILSRISGGNPSYIDGLLQVSGSNANLFLLNPSGIVFGSNAQLNLAGDFTASTASGIGFGEEFWSGNTDYTALVGAPTEFAFTGNGAIINAGDLAVSSGRSLNLFASNVVNTGTLTAAGGNVQIMAVPGTNTLRLNQTGQILGLEFDAPTNNLAITDLPQLLTGSSIDTGLVVENGVVKLAADQTVISPNSGSTFVNGLVDVSGEQGGNVGIFGQAIAIHDATIDASGINSGGEILVGGDYLGSGDRPRALTTFVDANSVLDSSAINTGDGGRIIVWSDARTDFDGFLYAKGGENFGNGGFAEISSKNILDIPAGWSQRINVGAVNGRVGKLLFDPNDITIVDAAGGGVPSVITNPEDATDSGNTLLDSDINAFLLGNDLEITTATGFGGSGNITVASGVNITNFPNTLTLTANRAITVSGTISPSGGRLVLNAGSDIFYPSTITQLALGAIDVNFQAGGNMFIDGNIFTGGGSVTLLASGSISTRDIVTAGGAVTFTSINNRISTRDIRTGGGVVTLNSLGEMSIGNINTRSSVAGAVTLSSESPIRVNGIDASGIISAGTPSTGGTVNINSNINPGLGQPFGGIRITGSPISINTSGSLGGANGDINITYSGGTSGDLPFVVGDSSINGTTGIITTGSETITSGAFSGNYVQGTSPGKISINSLKTPLSTQQITTDPNLSTDPNLDGSSSDGDCQADCDYTDESDDLDDGFAAETEATNFVQIQTKLSGIREQTGVNPVLVYAFFVPAESENPAAKESSFLKENKLQIKAQQDRTQWEFRGDRLTDFLNAENRFLGQDRSIPPNTPLRLVMVTPEGETIQYEVPDATYATVMREARNLMRGVTNPQFGNVYLNPAQYLYDVLIRPLEADLGEKGIANIAFVMDEGLRALPLAALHDGEQFLIEKYSVGLMPSFSLTNTSAYVSPGDNQLIAMGAAKFDDASDLPSAPLEAQIIGDNIWGDGDVFLNSQFTVANLIAARERTPYGIVHLATHGEFLPGEQGNSYIQFQDQKLSLADLAELGLNNPPIELLVLSACRTAIGDRQAELGFAGLALASGAKSALGSIWNVSDEGTMGLMTKFYQELKTSPIKAEALRQAQIAMLRGEVRINGNELETRGGDSILLPTNNQRFLNPDLSHPYFWSGFTLVGNPW